MKANWYEEEPNSTPAYIEVRDAYGGTLRLSLVRYDKDGDETE